MSGRRIAFLDIDGTLIDSTESIAPSTVEAVRTARANGHLVYICTGRGAAEVYPAVRDIGFDGEITAGGGFASVGGDQVISRTMSEESASRMIAFYEQEGFDFYLQAYDELYPSPGLAGRFAGYLASDLARRPGGRDRATTPSAPDEHPALRAFSNVRPYARNGIAKSVFLGDEPTAFARAAAALDGEFHVITGTIPHLGTGSGEVSLAGVNKGTTILMLLARLGLGAEAAIGIGDSSNDIEMLQICGVGIAMGNAPDDIKMHADRVTTEVLDDGVWNAFRDLGLV